MMENHRQRKVRLAYSSSKQPMNENVKTENVESNKNDKYD